MTTNIFTTEILDLPADSATALRAQIGLEPEATLKVSYLPGPGDLETTHDYWLDGAFDPGVPSIAYSTMFFELCTALDVTEAQLITRADTASPANQRGRFTFEKVAYGPRRPYSGYYQRRLGYARACARALAKFRPHIAIIASDFDWQFMPLLSGTTDKIILSVHNTWWPMSNKAVSARSKLTRFLIGAALGKVRSAVCTSEECKRQLLSMVNTSIPAFTAVPQQTGRQDFQPRTQSPTNLLYLGRIERAKGVFDLLDAFERLRSTRPQLRLTYAGGGNVLEELKTTIAARELSSSVDVLGHIAAKQVQTVLKTSDLLICPTRTSFNEGLAFVCFEAAAHGVPSVMSAVVPAQDLLQKSAIVFTPDSTEALSTAISQVVDNADYYADLSRQAIKDAEILFDRSQAWGSQLFRAMMAS